jgi:hypothetical protein
VLQKIGLRFERMIELTRDRGALCLYGPAAGPFTAVSRAAGAESA